MVTECSCCLTSSTTHLGGDAFSYFRTELNIATSRQTEALVGHQIYTNNQSMADCYFEPCHAWQIKGDQLIKLLFSQLVKY